MTEFECSQAQKYNCRDSCCRLFAGVAFCDIESNCLATPTWIIILVPVLLGLAALALIIVMLVRLKSRTVVDRYTFVRNQNSRLTKMYIFIHV